MVHMSAWGHTRDASLSVKARFFFQNRCFSDGLLGFGECDMFTKLQRSHFQVL